MNISFRALLLILLFPGNKTVSGQQSGNVIDWTMTVDRAGSCRSHPEHTYQIFIPPAEQGVKLPLMVVIDPHGDGKLAVGGFKEAARKYRMAIVGSNLIKNNDPVFLKEITELIDDVKSLYPVGNQLYIGGFSGGARMALGYALQHPVNGVLACGALAQTKEISQIHCRIFSITGMDDFNFTEAAPFVLDPLSMPSNLSVEITKASHSWPDKKLLSLATGYLLLANPSINGTDKQKEIIRFIDEQKHRVDSLVRKNEIIRAVLIAHYMSNMASTEKENSFSVTSEKLMKNENYRIQINKLVQSLRMESNLRENYTQALFEKDPVWWNKEIVLLNSGIESEKDAFTRMAFSRIKGFLGIACYSLCQQAAEERDALKLAQILSVYRIVEPQNPEIQRFSGILEKMKL